MLEFMRQGGPVMWPLLMRRRAQDALDDTMANMKRVAEAGA